MRKHVSQRCTPPGQPLARRLALAALLLALGVHAGRADEYWIAWEGDDLPENQGWERNWGNWQGQYQGPGAVRTLANGVLSYDSMYDPYVWDFSVMRRPGQMDPDPGEEFLMQWRLRVDQVTHWWGDPTMFVSSDDIGEGNCYILSFVWNDGSVVSAFEPNVAIPVGTREFHTYEMRSPDMRTYELWIDERVALRGSFWLRWTPSRLAWGDGTQGVASVHHWDYFRFGVIPVRPTGDINCDGTVDFDDINPFVLALTDPVGYQREYPACPLRNADVNADGRVDFGDINPFVALLTGG